MNVKAVTPFSSLPTLPINNISKKRSEMTKWFGARAAFLQLSIIALATFCLTPAQARDTLNEVNPHAGFSSVSKAYSDMDKRYVRIGMPRDIAQVRRISVGQSQAALQAVLGRAAHRNSDGSLEFNLSLPLVGRDRLICQYRVYFDGAGKVSHAAWRRPQCADLVAGKRN
ncbi:hypothetical protein [Ochrobactrum sp. BTU1]|uniref:hypothetical protein n=1 Tax=Ochrobactrum sp. BTU1 TaxID=2840456 RepID=UPI001C03A7B1|nr:hypothetical protein KMS41_21585 [Ochrobactrum sp. BTU1]